METAKTLVEQFFHETPNIAMTDLFRLDCEDENMFTTWEDADIYPVDLDVLVAVLNWKYFAVFCETGLHILPILLVLEHPTWCPLYEKFPMIARPTHEELLDAIKSIDTAKLKSDFDRIYQQFKGEKADDWFLELTMAEQMKVTGLPTIQAATDFWTKLPPLQKYAFYEQHGKPRT